MRISETTVGVYLTLEYRLRRPGIMARSRAIRYLQGVVSDVSEVGVSQLVTSTLPQFWMFKADGTPLLEDPLFPNYSSRATLI